MSDRLLMRAEEIPKQAMSRRRFFRAAVACAAFPFATTAYAREIEPFWLDIHEVDLKITGLPVSFDGFRIAQLTDLHIDGHIPGEYLRRVVDHVNNLNVDLVCVTGDVVNHNAAWTGYAADLLGSIKSPTIVSFGNHDYAPMTARPRAVTYVAAPLNRDLERAGCKVLRNRAMTIQRNAEKLWFVGIEDLWSDYYSPADAFAMVPTEATAICLSHNPDSAQDVANFGARVVLSGHTHGGQIRVPLLGAPLLPVFNRKLDQGLFKINDRTQLYISRGIGFLMRARFMCRPELPVFTLRRI